MPLTLFLAVNFWEIDVLLAHKLPVLDRREAIAAQKRIDSIRASIAGKRAQFANMDTASRKVAEAELDTSESALWDLQRELVLLCAESLEIKHQIEMSFPQQRPESIASTRTSVLRDTMSSTLP